MLFPPEFFDIFGIAVFAYITALTLWAMRTKKSIPRWALIVLCAIGIAGLAVEGFMVYVFYLR